MIDIQSATAEIRRGIKKKKERKKPPGKNIMACLFHGEAIMNKLNQRLVEV